MSKNLLNDLYKPDGKRLTTMVVGRPGSGKSYFLNKTLREYATKSQDENWRMVYVCPKHEAQLSKEPPIGVDGMEQHLRKNRVATVYPDPDYVEAEVEYVIDLMFAMKNANPDFTATLCVDDAQTFLSSRKQASPQFRRLALTGRSKGIRFVAVSHSLIFNKDLEGSTSFIVNFTLPVKLFHKDAMIRYGFDFEPYVEPLADTEYSFVFYDVTKSRATLYEPIS